MAFRISRPAKRRTEARQWSEDELIWGVPRRPGYDDQDDPKGHAGLTQHAFEPGNDERAICGFEPPKRAGSATAKPRAQLAMPTARLNPRCVKCAALIATPDVPSLLPTLAAIEGAAIEAEAASDAEAAANADAGSDDADAGSEDAAADVERPMKKPDASEEVAPAAAPHAPVMVQRTPTAEPSKQRA